MTGGPLVTVAVVGATLVAGAAGAVARALVVAAASRRAGRASARSWGTAAVNLVGTALLAGLALGARRELVGPIAPLVVGVGFAGALTTFSGWVVDAVRFAQAGARSWTRAVGVELAGQLALGTLLAMVVLGVHPGA